MDKRYKLLELCVMLLLSSVCCFAQDAMHVLNLTSEGSLKDVFDAGLEPRNVRGLESRSCEVKDSRLAFLLSNGKTLDIDAKRAEFFVYENDLLGYIQAYTDYLTLDEAYEKGRVLLDVLGQSPQGLKAFIEKVRANPLGANDGFGIRSPSGPQSRVNVFYLPGATAEKPLRLAIKIEWNRPPMERRHRQDQIKPPKGYEHLSMEAFGRSTVVSATPTSTVQSSSPTSKPVQQAQSAVSRNLAAEAKESPPSSFPLIPVVILAVVIIGVIVFLLRRKSP